MQHRGEEVRFLGQAQQREALERAGFGFAAYNKPGSWTATGKRVTLKNALGFLSLLTGRSLGRDLNTNVEKNPTDLFVIDCLLFGVLDAAARADFAVLPDHVLTEVMSATQSRRGPSAVKRCCTRSVGRTRAGSECVVNTFLPRSAPRTPSDRVIRPV
jgi:hypothetical protein